jgi:hypothetical protein
MQAFGVQTVHPGKLKFMEGKRTAQTADQESTPRFPHFRRATCVHQGRRRRRIQAFGAQTVHLGKLKLMEGKRTARTADQESTPRCPHSRRVRCALQGRPRRTMEARNAQTVSLVKPKLTQEKCTALTVTQDRLRNKRDPQYALFAQMVGSRRQMAR